MNDSPLMTDADNLKAWERLIEIQFKFTIVIFLLRHVNFIAFIKGTGQQKGQDLFATAGPLRAVLCDLCESSTTPAISVRLSICPVGRSYCDLASPQRQAIRSRTFIMKNAASLVFGKYNQYNLYCYYILLLYIYYCKRNIEVVHCYAAGDTTVNLE